MKIMANRRFGGNQGNQRPGGNNRNFGAGGGGGGPSSNINPWQGGVAPGNSNNNIQNQLALALTSLIQQTQQPSDGPPSLLNMNTSTGFFNQDQFNNQNRFGVNRIGGRQDFRRNEPYNKNRVGGWRDNRPNNRGNNSSKNNRSNKNQRTPNTDQKKKPIDKSIKKESESEDTSKEVKTEDESDVRDENEPKQVKPTKYDELPNGLLHCFVCNKSMWDGESFQNHLGGKAHKQMISSLEESFQITVNILRENMRLNEERRMIEFERMQRSRRYQQHNIQEPESHCNMCDLKFMGKIVVHRQTEGHQRLKRFLHPKCKRCNLEFPSRMEWVDHQFAPEHLFKLKEYLESKNLDPSEYKMRKDPEMDTEPLLEEGLQNEDDNPVLEMSDDLQNLYNRIPVYKPNRAVSKESVSAASGFICNLCQLFMPSEEESQTHLKSFRHYHAFVDGIKVKYQKAANEKKKAEEEAAALAVVKAEAENTEEKNGEAGEEANENTNDDEELENVLNEIYDPFVADEGEGEDKDGDVNMAKVEEEEKEEVKEEEVKKPSVAPAPVPATTTPTTASGRPKRGGSVKNGAGPKSKKTKA